METHAVFLRLDGRRCVVVGGDHHVAPKVEACRRAGAEVTVIAPAVTEPIARLVAAGHVRHLVRSWQPGDLRGAFVAYASTRDPVLIAALCDEAARERVLLNVADVPEACTFLAPAVVRRGDLQVAVGTGGTSPALAARLRRQLDEQLGPEYETLVAILGAVRRALEARPERGTVLGALVDSPLLDLVRQRDRDGIERLLAEHAGARCTLAALGVEVGA